MLWLPCQGACVQSLVRNNAQCKRPRLRALQSRALNVFALHRGSPDAEVNAGEPLAPVIPLLDPPNFSLSSIRHLCSSS